MTIALLAAYISLLRAIGGPAWRVVVLITVAGAASGVSGMLCLAQAMRMADKANEPRLSAALIVLLGLCLLGAAILSLIARPLYFTTA